MNYFFTADTHFNHDNIRRFSNRPHKNVKEMNDDIINKNNEKIGSNDTLIHLGDYSFGDARDVKEFIGRTNCNIMFIYGNHDRVLKDYKRLFWEKNKVTFLGDYHEMEIEDRKIVLCHYPLLSWKHKHHGAWMLHGHCHYNLRATRKESNILGRILDVGVDGNSFEPYSYEELDTIMESKKWNTSISELNDHHVNNS